MSNLFEDLIPAESPPGVSVLYGVITGSSPLRVRIDGDPGPLPMTPTSTVATAVGERVVLLKHGRQLAVIGVIGGVGGATGSETITTSDPAGQDTVLHGLGYTPTNVQLQVDRPNSGSDDIAQLAHLSVWAVSSTTITIQAVRVDTGAVFAGQSIGVMWRAV